MRCGSIQTSKSQTHSLLPAERLQGLKRDKSEVILVWNIQHSLHMDKGKWNDERLWQCVLFERGAVTLKSISLYKSRGKWAAERKVCHSHPVVNTASPDHESNEWQMKVRSDPCYCTADSKCFPLKMTSKVCPEVCFYRCALSLIFAYLQLPWFLAPRLLCLPADSVKINGSSIWYRLMKSYPPWVTGSGLPGQSNTRPLLLHLLQSTTNSYATR